MANFNDFWKELQKATGDFVEANWKDVKDAALKDGSGFMDKAKKDLQRWTTLVAEGRLTKQDFEFLVKGKKDLAAMEALKQAGLTEVRVGRFTNGLIEVVTTTAFKVLT